MLSVHLGKKTPRTQAEYLEFGRKPGATKNHLIELLSASFLTFPMILHCAPEPSKTARRAEPHRIGASAAALASLLTLSTYAPLRRDKDDLPYVIHTTNSLAFV